MLSVDLPLSCIACFFAQCKFFVKMAMHKTVRRFGWTVNKIAGFATYNLKFGPNSDSPKCHYSKLGAIYNIILTISLSVVLLKTEIDSHYDVDNTENNLIRMIKSAETTLGVIAMVSVHLTYVLAQKDVVHIQNCIAEIGVALFLFDHRYKAKSLTKFYLKYFLVQQSVYVVQIVTQHLVYDLSSSYHLTFLCFLIGFFLFQYTSYVKKLSDQLQHLNDLLQALKTSHETQLGFYFNISVKRLDRIRKLHAVIYAMTKKVADFYSFAMLTSTTYLLISQTISVHYTMESLLNEWDDEMFGVFMLNNFSWIVGQAGPIVHLTNGVDNLNYEIRNTAEIVHDLYTKTNNKELKVKLKEFSSKLLNHNGDFTAAHLFPINSTLLHSMMTAVTQYIIIIVQFNSTKNKKEESNKRGGDG